MFIKLSYLLSSLLYKDVRSIPSGESGRPDSNCLVRSDTILKPCDGIGDDPITRKCLLSSGRKDEPSIMLLLLPINDTLLDG